MKNLINKNTKLNITPLVSLYYTKLLLILFIFLSFSFQLSGQDWKVLMVRGNVNSSGEKLEDSGVFSQDDEITFSNTSDAMMVALVEDNSNIKLVLPEGYILDESLGQTCAQGECAPVWEDPMIERRQNQVLTERDADGNLTTTIIHVLYVEQIGNVSYIEVKSDRSKEEKELKYDKDLFRKNVSDKILKKKIKKNNFTHTASAKNIAGHITRINQTATNKNPNAILIVTPVASSTRTNNPHPIGVWYSEGKWTIFNQNFNKMPVGAKFNILVIQKKNENAYIHQVSKQNLEKTVRSPRNRTSKSLSHRTVLSHKKINNNPNAVIFITQNWGASGPYNKQDVGVVYNKKTGKWLIANLNGKSMPLGAKFNVYIAE